MPDYRIRPATIDDVDVEALVHRRRGLARMVMEAIHAWCREAGVTTVALNSSADGQPLYESLGYRVRSNPMMVASLTREV